MPSFTRRGMMIAAGAALVSGPGAMSAVLAQGTEVTTEMILNDPEAPVGGNDRGDLTIVAFLDYNCPYCKKAAPDLKRVVEEDGAIRLVYKDWPVIRPTSLDGATMALAAKYQGRYEAAHDALMGIPGSGITAERMRQQLAAAGIDMPQLDADMTARSREIDGLINRNMAQADALGLMGTPTYLVGPYRASTMDYDGFREIVADARIRQTEME